jgi:hypothetical protein
MVKIYVRAIREGRMTIEQVPDKWRAEVYAALQAEETE